MKLLLIPISLLLLQGCAFIERQIGLEEDNFGEELIEFGIKTQTGIDVDLTPSSKE